MENPTTSKSVGCSLRPSVPFPTDRRSSPMTVYCFITVLIIASSSRRLFQLERGINRLGPHLRDRCRSISHGVEVHSDDTSFAFWRFRAILPFRITETSYSNVQAIAIDVNVASLNVTPSFTREANLRRLESDAFALRNQRPRLFIDTLVRQTRERAVYATVPIISAIFASARSFPQ